MTTANTVGAGQRHYTAEIYLAGYLMETVNFTVKDADLMLPQVQLTLPSTQRKEKPRVSGFFG